MWDKLGVLRRKCRKKLKASRRGPVWVDFREDVELGTNMTHHRGNRRNATGHCVAVVKSEESCWGGANAGCPSGERAAEK